MNDKPTYQELESQIAELKKQNKLLQQKSSFQNEEKSEALFKQLIKNSFDMFILLDSEGVQQFVSESCENILGYKPKELMGISVIEKMIHPEDQESTKKALLDIIENNAHGGAQYRHHHKNGSWVYLEAVGSNQLDNPDIKSVVLNVRDISDKKQAEEKLKEIDIKYKDLVETADIAILIDDENGFFKYFNNKFCKIFGYTKEEINQLPIRSLVHPDDVEFVMSHHNNRIKGETVNAKYEFRGVRKSGKTVHLMTSAVPKKSNGKVIGTRSYVWDITERKLMENTLFENQYRFEKAQALGHVGNWDYNLKTETFLISDESKRIYGFNSDSNNFSTEQAENCIPERERVHQALIDLIDHDKKYDIEFEIIPTDQSPRKIIHSIAELEKDASNNPLRVRGVILDITDRKKAELALKESEAKLKESNNTKDKFFSIIAHDLKSPFNSMLGFSKMLETKFDKYDTKKKKRFISIINQELNNTYKLLENLLYWSQSQKGSIEFKPEIINLHLFWDETSKSFVQSAENKSIEFICQIPENIDITVDKEMFSTIIRNLISNAIKFTPKFGEILIDALITDDNRSVEILVQDNGVGISKEIQTKIFDLGEYTSTQGTENEKGTGLGLILCKEFAEKHGGKIDLESEEGKGSIFTITLPL